MANAYFLLLFRVFLVEKKLVVALSHIETRLSVLQLHRLGGKGLLHSNSVFLYVEKLLNKLLQRFEVTLVSCDVSWSEVVTAHEGVEGSIGFKGLLGTHGLDTWLGKGNLMVHVAV